ncbi:thyroid receptor-interacting protein 11 isoform X2 [Culex pipiens pallens]|uniref:thyroid receptor-interacting protein 11 isoform X2 n=1 Tax=Culex pipiens pallens TaxID=42434 RepID=UPI001953D353|nr:thyroid receptor-interacting protein 11 isoform X2 [Culex pipiens pallens]
MSWLNDSLNKVKGQITSFAQEVLAEGIVEEETEEEIEGRRFNPIKELEHAKDQIGQLTGLCATQDQEIATLRKQIAEFQQLKTEQALPSSKLTDQNAGPSTSTQHPPVPAASALEDSWFWDPEQNVSSTSSSSKKDDDPENDSPRSGADLTTIPLEPPATEGEIIERLHRQLTDKSQQLKKQMLENALLNENLTQMSGENRELNENIEELDRQHELVVENLLTAKKNLQDRCSQLEEELRIKQGEASVTKELDELKVSYGKLEQSYVNSCQESVQLKAELERIVVENIDAVAGLEGEITELKKTLEESQNSSEAVDHKSNTLARENAKLDEQLAILKDENEQLGKKLEQMTTQSEQLAKAEDECEQLKRELEELKRKSEEDAFVALDQTELEELRKNYEALAAEVERWKTDCDRLQEDNLVLQKKLEERKPDETQVAQLQQEVSELQNELRSVIIDNSVQLDAKEKEWQEKLNFVKAENSRIQHSKDTLEADLMQYEKECGNLMKNNDLLIAEIDNLKCKKLETINENAEDSIVILERQLEESTMLNKSLEDEYQEVNKKLEEVLEEREELDAKVENYQKTLEEKTRIVYDLRMTVEALEAEKAHLLFEVNEAKAKESTSEELDELEQHKLQVEDLRAQLSTINEDHASLVLKLQQLQQTSIENTRNSEAKLSELEAKESAIKQLQADLLRVSETANETTSDGAAKVLEERLEAEASKATALAVEKDEVEEKLAKAVEELDQVRAEFEEASKSNATKVAELTQAVEGITQQKDNLVQLVTVKHNENVQYHAEIQRLSQLLQTELAAKNEAKADSDECSSLRERLAQLEAQTSKLADFDKMADQIQFLREKSDILTNNLLIEQNNQKVLQQEKQEVIEQKNGLAKDLERLRQHLLEIEEAHTLETVELQQRYDEARGKLQTLEEDVKKSSNAQKSASIRANQHAETLQAQYHLLQQQRDELAAKLSAADDRDYKNLASLTNLQVALEQFQNNKERDIELATLAIRRDLEQAQAREMALKGDIRQLQQQLADAKNGLLAAARISDQLEIAQVTVASLREELSKSNDRYLQLEGRLQATEANQADKVEKSLVKNLVIGYVVAPNQNDKHQILKLISAVLTMDQNECTKVGLNKSGGGWFNSILGSGAAATNYNKESLTEAFVKFLEKESTPRPPNPAGSSLLNIMANQPSPPSTHPSRTTTPTQASAAADQVPVTPVQPVILLGGPTEFQPQRSSSSILKDILSDS